MFSATMRRLGHQGLAIVMRIVLFLPKRARRVVLRAVRCLGRSSVSKVGLRLLRVLRKASLTIRCRGCLSSPTCANPTFRVPSTSRCVNLLARYVRRLHPRVIVRQLANSKPGSLLVTPL